MARGMARGTAKGTATATTPERRARYNGRMAPPRYLPDEPLLLSYVVGAAMIIDLSERQSLLAAPTALDRLRLERSLLVRETAMFRATTSRPAPDFAFEQFSQN